jgi:hypothetical protein
MLRSDRDCMPSPCQLQRCCKANNSGSGSIVSRVLSTLATAALPGWLPDLPSHHYSVLPIHWGRRCAIHCGRRYTLLIQNNILVVNTQPCPVTEGPRGTRVTVASAVLKPTASCSRLLYITTAASKGATSSRACKVCNDLNSNYITAFKVPLLTITLLR